nr:hypothetical protein CFP56_07970 [Quercus suber]POE79907.1 hypothetical protein CFP56_07973 [Quercus suber]
MPQHVVQDDGGRELVWWCRNGCAPVVGPGEKHTFQASRPTWRATGKKALDRGGAGGAAALQMTAVNAKEAKRDKLIRKRRARRLRSCLGGGGSMGKVGSPDGEQNIAMDAISV